MSSHIILPSSTPTFDCEIPGCEEKFLDKGAYLRHVPRCARKHRSSLITTSEEHQAAIDADPFRRVYDPEALDWILKRNRESR
jgi:hypothetical protein